MTDYAIIIGENNPKASRKVQEALFAVGFKWSNVNDTLVRTDGVIILWARFPWLQYTPENHHMFTNEPLHNSTVLSPSYVIAHAAELDGAQKIWEVAEEGYRIVTIQEREDNAYPTDCEVRWVGNSGQWISSIADACWKRFESDMNDRNFAVPIDYKFKPSTVEVVCEGKTVELSRESAKALNLI